jgi:hypothetical protein
MASTLRAGGVVDKLLKKERKKRKADKLSGSSGKKRKKKDASSDGNEAVRGSASKTRRSPKARGRLNQRVANASATATLVTAEQVQYTRVGQGKELFPGMDGRSFIARRLQEHYGGICQDMGGMDQMSTIERALSKQMASLITIGEDMVAQRSIDDPEYDYLEHLACVKTVNQVGRTLGTKRRMRPVKEVTLDDYIEQGENE